ncbi:MAG: lactate racemase domain-containing protein [Anaerolineae bacterium]
MKEVLVEYGDGKMPIRVPDHAVVVRYGETYTDPPPVDPVEATRKALDHPLGLPPIRDLVGPRSRVVIAFPDRVKGGFHERTHRRTAIPLILEDLERAGVKEENITLLCANGLHRKNTREEMYQYLPRAVVDRFWGRRLVCHDCEDPDMMVDLGEDEFGDQVEFNRLAAEADLCILLGHAQGNPYGGYSGGAKMPATGLTGWRSIRCHHTPASMHRPDFVPATTESFFRRQLQTIVRTIEERIGKKLFLVDAVVGTHAEVLGVYAGAVEEVEKASWELARRRTDVYLDMEKADVLVVGLPRAFHYGPGMGTSPVLMKQAIGATLSRCLGAFREGGVVIAPGLCDGWFNDDWFPSYREIYQLYQEHCTSVTDLIQFEELVSHREEYIYKYRYGYAYHPFHGFSMMYMGEIASHHTSAIYMPGARKPGYARSMGIIPTKTFDEALQDAARFVGKDPRILVLPGYLLMVPPHLFATRS